MLLRGRLMAAVVGEDRRTRQALLIRPGRSRNGPFYAPPMLREAVAAGLFDGRPVHAFDEVDTAGRPRKKNHVEDPRLVGRTFGNVVGVTGKARYVEGQGVVAPITFLETDQGEAALRQVEAIERAGALDVVGLSMDASGEQDPRTGWARIRHVASVDVVTEPAAGGRVLHRIAASVSHGGIPTMKHVLKYARERFPRLTEGLSDSATTFGVARHVGTRAKADEASRAELSKFLGLDAAGTKRLAESEGMDLLEVGHDFVARVTEAYEKSVEGGGTVEKPTELEEANRLAEAARKDAEKVAHELEVTRTSIRLTEALSTAKLPPETETRIRECFAGKSATAEEIKAKIEAERKYVDGLVGSAMRAGAGVRVLESSEDVQTAILAHMFNPHQVPLREANAADGKPIARQPFMFSFKEYLYQRFGLRMEELAYGGQDTRVRFREAVDTTAFAKVFADALNRAVQAAYVGAIRRDADWRKLVRVVGYSDFRTQHVITVGYYGTIPTVAKKGTYLALTTPTDREETLSLAKKGGLESIAMEDMLNDDLNLWQTLIQRIGQACQETAYEAVMALFRVSSMPTMQDTYKLGSASRSPANLGTNVLSTTLATAKTSFFASLQGMMAATGGSGQKKGILPRYLIVPLEKLEATGGLLNSIQGGNTSIAVDEALRVILGAARPEPIVDYGEDTTTDWKLLADPLRAEVARFATLGGRTEPEIFIADDQRFGNLFTRDQLDLKVRFIFAAAAVDPTGFYINDAAS